MTMFPVVDRVAENTVPPDLPLWTRAEIDSALSVSIWLGDHRGIDMLLAELTRRNKKADKEASDETDAHK